MFNVRLTMWIMIFFNAVSFFYLFFNIDFHQDLIKTIIIVSIAILSSELMVFAPRKINTVGKIGDREPNFCMLFLCSSFSTYSFLNSSILLAFINPFVIIYGIYANNKNYFKNKEED